MRKELSKKFMSYVAVSAMIFGVCSKVRATTLYNHDDLFVSGNNNLDYNYNYNTSSRAESYSSWGTSSNLETTSGNYLCSDSNTMRSFCSNTNTTKSAWNSFESDNWAVGNNQKFANKINNVVFDSSINNAVISYSDNYNTKNQYDNGYGQIASRCVDVLSKVCDEFMSDEKFGKYVKLERERIKAEKNQKKIINQVNNTHIDNSRTNINNTNFDYSNNYNTSYNTNNQYGTNYNTNYNTEYNYDANYNSSYNSSYNNYNNNGYYNGGYGY